MSLSRIDSGEPLIPFILISMINSNTLSASFESSDTASRNWSSIVSVISAYCAAPALVDSIMDFAN